MHILVQIDESIMFIPNGHVSTKSALNHIIIYINIFLYITLITFG